MRDVLEEPHVIREAGDPWRVVPDADVTLHDVTAPAQAEAEPVVADRGVVLDELIGALDGDAARGPLDRQR
jgi:hypothetical protein